MQLDGSWPMHDLRLFQIPPKKIYVLLPWQLGL